MTKVKICGITNLEDALVSAKFGADALGFNFYKNSPRYITPSLAREIIKQIPNDMLKVGVFVNESIEQIAETIDEAGLDAIQLHGDETPIFVREVNSRSEKQVIKAFRVSPAFRPDEVYQYEIDSILLDAFSLCEFGGSGQTFDWSAAGQLTDRYSVYLAGGLDPENVGWAIEGVRPYAVDVCSGLESEKGKKDHRRIKTFMENVRNQR